MTNVQGTIYLIHFERPLAHARHYLGWASNLEKRITHHRRGTGGNLMRVIKEKGIGWQVVRTWAGDRFLERRFKNAANTPRLCPVCTAGRPAPARYAQEVPCGL